ncbi:MAG: Arm DNA-binding domain-containing protein, partial [Methylocystis sp.]
VRPIVRPDFIMAQNKLTARTVMTKVAGRYGDGGGLWLVVSKTGAKKWVYRFSWQGCPGSAPMGQFLS